MFVLPSEALHLGLYHLLLFVQEVNRLIHMRVDTCWCMWIYNCRPMHELFFFSLELDGVYFFKILVFLGEDHVLLHDLAILLGRQRHLVLLKPILYLLTFGLKFDFLLNKLLLLLKLIWIELVWVILRQRRCPLGSLFVCVMDRRLLRLRVLTIKVGSWIMLHWLRLHGVILIVARVVGPCHILALWAVSCVLPLHQRLVLPVQAVGSPAAVLVIECKDRSLFDGLTSLVVRVFSLFIVFCQHVIDLGVEVLLVEEGV